MHGGLVASLIDCAGASAVAQASKRPPATSNLTVSYLAAGRVGPLRAEAELLRLGQNHGVCSVRVYDNGMEDRFVVTALSPSTSLTDPSSVRRPVSGLQQIRRGHHGGRLSPEHFAALVREPP